MLSEVRREFPVGIDGNERARIPRLPQTDNARSRALVGASARSPETLFPRRNLSRSADGRFSFSPANARSFIRSPPIFLLRFPAACSRVKRGRSWQAMCNVMQPACIAVGNSRHPAWWCMHRWNRDFLRIYRVNVSLRRFPLSGSLQVFLSESEKRVYIVDILSIIAEYALSRGENTSTSHTVLCLVNLASEKFHWKRGKKDLVNSIILLSACEVSMLGH